MLHLKKRMSLETGRYPGGGKSRDRRPELLLLWIAVITALLLDGGNALSCWKPGGCGMTAYAATPVEELIREQAERLPLDQVEQFWGRLMRQYGGYFPDAAAPSFMDLLLGAKEISPGSIFSGLLRYFFHELIYGGKLLASIVILSVFSMLLETLQSSFEKNNVSKIAYAISFLVLMIMAVNSFNLAIGYAKSAISEMTHFMIAVVPLLLTLLASMGNVVSVSVLHPLIVFMVYAIGTVIYFFVFPLLFFSAVLHIVSALSDKYKVTQLANLLRNISLGCLGIFVTVFLGVVSVQGGAGAIVDGVTIRTAKYIAGNFVPVVGRLFSDASETVIGASLLVKNAVGLSGVVIILVLCAFPALKIIALAFIYNLSAAVMQPLGDHPMTACLATIGKSLIYVFAALAAVGLMFFLAITILIAAGNVSVMMR
ncbi:MULTISPECIES: stage III sporulation protein AE [Paenibacillus]|uniref:Stage III sporulation protein AE n=1 Tax=Paenibacillus naphthalenovorans TaxID=162209 RepID=A0A0U2MXF0_9BACL|nr:MULTISPECIES: stage III sporulation protein AE [Paenibacillus]ALS22799.1 stage III sporulation protein AE [Paenibacillus naphthalenovorans]NTZ17595.1 stage III sporulation protein AE [Paenibacillus sp. JMULE4]GCL70593.1 stage III sporulation protein AE [Paenibacillus naphthalenovorans]SDH77446.1 stage III sporulation protein AE [Paenibacillus naphthalenovorans]